MHFRSVFSLSLALAFSVPAFAHDYRAGNLRIAHPYARSTVAGQPSGAAYVSIENKGRDGDRLISIASPVAGGASIHTMSMDGNVMKMREVDGIDIKRASRVTMQPGDGYHIMLTGLKRPLKAGDKFPLTLTFEKAGKVEVSVWVENQDAGEHAHHQDGPMRH